MVGARVYNHGKKFDVLDEEFINLKKEVMRHKECLTGVVDDGLGPEEHATDDADFKSFIVWKSNKSTKINELNQELETK